MSDRDMPEETPASFRPDSAVTAARSRRQFLKEAAAVGLGAAALAQTAPGTAAAAVLGEVGGNAPARDKRAPETLLDEVGHLARMVTRGEVAAWKAELKTKERPAPERAALLHVHLGEFALAGEREPKRAAWHFRVAQRLLRTGHPLYGLAQFDAAIAQFYCGLYEQSAEAFAKLLAPRPVRWGFDKRRCALWHRHARACAGYHAAPGLLGVPRPKELDPLCGAGGLAVCLRAHGLPFDEKTVLSVCRVTGMGSSFQDILDACARLGTVVGRPVVASEAGLKALPKPLVAFVEHDHFVALTRADEKGVTYLCTDCGCWPGGEVNLSWEQWRSLDPGLYLSVVKAGSHEDRVLSALLDREKGGHEAKPEHGVRLASAGDGTAGIAGAVQLSALYRHLVGNVVLYTAPAASASCGHKMDSLHCYLENCPTDSCPTGTCHGPSAGDPVNLASGEEEYHPEPDLVVYNPNGPSVVWGRLYSSLRGQNGSYQSDDFGIGWSQTYNAYVFTPSRVVLPAPPSTEPPHQPSPTPQPPPPGPGAPPPILPPPLYGWLPEPVSPPTRRGTSTAISTLMAASTRISIPSPSPTGGAGSRASPPNPWRQRPAHKTRRRKRTATASTRSRSSPPSRIFRGR